jgi:pimeloyl-ACP methyl ester carboxylesterase
MTAPTRARNGSYIDVAGTRTYFEVTGSGAPLVLLHGGLCPAETLDAQTAALVEKYQVYVPERVGHGRTPDVAGPYTYEGMAQHMVAFVDSLGITSAHFVGWSDGALVALLVALRRPKLVSKLVLIDQFVTPEGARPGFVESTAALTVDAAPAMLVDLYAASSPDGPEHFPVVFDKVHSMWTGATGIEVADLGRIACPTLLMAGDDGSMTSAHIDAMRRALRDVQLAVVPGTSHSVVLEKPDIVNRLIVDFLAVDQVPKLFDMSSAT